MRTVLIALAPSRPLRPGSFPGRCRFYRGKTIRIVVGIGRFGL